MIERSRVPDVAIPSVSLTQFFRAHAARCANETAFIDGMSGRSLTFAALLAHSASFAHGLIARGVKKQDRVAFLVPNLPEAAIAFHGTIAAGAVAMMLNPLSTKSELEKYFQLGKPARVVTVAPFVDLIRSTAPGLPIIVIGEASGPDGEPLTAFLGGPAEPPEVGIDPAEDLAAMPFSSGTTGFPKGVMLTHRNLVAQCLSLAAMTDAPIMPARSHCIAVLPFFHIYGIIAFLTYAPIHGVTVVTLPRFELEKYLELVRKYRPPILHLVPPILLALAKYPGELPEIRAALVGAAPLGLALAAEFTKRTGAMVSQVYGMTEVTGASHLGSREVDKNKPGSIGGLIANVEGKWVDGELWVRGPIVMKGYFGDAESTAQTIDAEGWLHTGDVGHTDADGDCFLVDRVKELIKYKGLQVAPAELESVLLTHDAVADCAVYAMPDADAGEIPKAAIVLKKDLAASADELMQFVQSRVAPQKRIRAVRFVEQIPKSASGKILRRLLVAAEQAQ